MAADVPDRKHPSPPPGMVKVKVEVHRVRLNADGTRTALSDETTSADGATISDLLPLLMKEGAGMSGSAAIADLLPRLLKERAATPARAPWRRAMFRVWAAIGIIGGLFIAHGSWAYRSDRAARAAYLASPSCAAERLTAPVVADGTDGCTIERASIVRLDEYTGGKGGRRYWVRVLQPSGRADAVPIGSGAVARQFWVRQKPLGAVWLQRFVSPGYHLSGHVSGIADEQEAVASLESPVTRAQPNGIELALGLSMLLMGIFGLRSMVRARA